MPFPTDLEAFEATGYTFNRAEICPVCGEDVQVFITPGKREITMNPIGLLSSPAVQHYNTCSPSIKEENQSALPPITMVSVRDKNITHCGWRDGTLEVWFNYGRYQYANVPQDIFVKITNPKQPYPNNIFTQLVKKHGELYPYTKLS